VFETVPGVAIVAAVEGWKGLLVGNFQGSDKTTVSWAGQHLPPIRKQVTYINEMYLLSGTSPSSLVYMFMYSFPNMLNT